MNTLKNHATPLQLMGFGGNSPSWGIIILVSRECTLTTAEPSRLTRVVAYLKGVKQYESKLNSICTLLYGYPRTSSTQKFSVPAYDRSYTWSYTPTKPPHLLPPSPLPTPLLPRQSNPLACCVCILLRDTPSTPFNAGSLAAGPTDNKLGFGSHVEAPDIK